MLGLYWMRMGLTWKLGVAKGFEERVGVMGLMILWIVRADE